MVVIFGVTLTDPCIQGVCTGMVGSNLPLHTVSQGQEEMIWICLTLILTSTCYFPVLSTDTSQYLFNTLEDTQKLRCFHSHIIASFTNTD